MTVMLLAQQSFFFFFFLMEKVTDLRPPVSCWTLTMWHRRNAGKAMHGLNKHVSSGSSVPTPHRVLDRGLFNGGWEGEQSASQLCDSRVTAGSSSSSSNSPTITDLLQHNLIAAD